jgi:hypothetical protein
MTVGWAAESSSQSSASGITDPAAVPPAAGLFESRGEANEGEGLPGAGGLAARARGDVVPARLPHQPDGQVAERRYHPRMLPLRACD